MFTTPHAPAPESQTHGFLFGADAFDIGLTDGSPLYKSLFLNSRQSEFTLIEQDETNETNHRTLRPKSHRHALFNFAAPFARYVLAIATTSFLLDAVASIPKQFVSIAHLRNSLVVVSMAILLNDFLTLALRRRRWYSQSAPLVNPTKGLGRRIFRRLGKHAWHVWYITQPARLLLVVTVGWALITLVMMAINSSPPPNPRELIQGIRLARNLLFLLGIGGLMWAAFNYMTEKNWTKQAIGGVFCFSFAAVASLAYSFSQGNPIDLDTNLGP